MHRNQLALLPLFIFCLILLSPSPQAESQLDLSGNLTVVSISNEVIDLVQLALTDPTSIEDPLHLES